MKILVTNDDGIEAEGLPPLVKWAMKLGAVTVVAPKYQQSGASHAINLHTPFEIKRVEFPGGIEAYSVDSTPADCVRYACIALDGKYDLVISGINKGYNTGEDIVYSGTAGAVFEAAYFGANALALSTKPSNSVNAVDTLDTIYSYMLENKLFSFCPLYNINIPPLVSGIRITRQAGRNYLDNIKCVGGDLYAPDGLKVYVNNHDPELDSDSVSDGFISITPITVCRTDTRVFDKLKNKINESAPPD